MPRHRRSTPRLELHVVEMDPDEVTVREGVPVTTARTLFDLAAVVFEQRPEHAFNEAEYRRLPSPVSVDALLARYPGRRGAANTDHRELDAIRPEQRLVVELDGFAAHGTRKAFEADRAKDRALQVAGWRVIRITWRQLTDEPDTIAAQLRALLTTHSQHTPNAPATLP